MSRPRLLDLFCGAGGAAVGYHRAGFDVVGVDIEPQPHYPFTFLRCDAVGMAQLCADRQVQGEANFFLGRIDAVHASPPCQVYSTLRHRSDREHPDLIEAVRIDLEASGFPYVIENVAGAPLINPVVLCGSSLGVDGCQLRRHRLFESNVAIMAPPCQHRGEAVTPCYTEHIGGFLLAEINARVVA